MHIGIRGLRDGLSRHLGAVRQGHTITVTDHGRPIARIVPVESPTKLEQLIADGLATPAASQSRPLPELADSRGSVSDLVARSGR